jgi:FkbM family methyltransferase
MTGAFGELRPSAAQERFRAMGARLPRNYFGRKAASLLLGPAGGRARRAYDVAIFGTQHARLHPYDNICEKRVFLTPQLWDGDERALLGDAISTFGGKAFNFVDVGANVGLYTLFARSEAVRAGAAFRAVCVEADEEMLGRMRFNISASGAEREVSIAACAASDRDGELRFAIDGKSRGLSRIDASGETLVASRPIASIVADAGFTHIDAMKVDIEGHEFEALGAFFRNAQPPLYPTMLILETSHEDAEKSAEDLVRRAGYRVRLKTARNSVLVKNV